MNDREAQFIGCVRDGHRWVPMRFRQDYPHRVCFWCGAVDPPVWIWTDQPDRRVRKLGTDRFILVSVPPDYNPAAYVEELLGT